MSLTISGWLAGLLLLIFTKFGVQIGSQDIQGFINVVLGLWGIVAVYIGRIRLGGVTWYGARK